MTIHLEYQDGKKDGYMASQIDYLPFYLTIRDGERKITIPWGKIKAFWIEG